MKRPLRSRDELNPDDPITLKDACAIFFHDAITPKSLRTERDKGNLVTEKIAGREFVTPAAIAAMRERCQTGPKKAASPEPEPGRRCRARRLWTPVHETRCGKSEIAVAERELAHQTAAQLMRPATLEAGKSGN